jgi:hypothetical protein
LNETVPSPWKKATSLVGLASSRHFALDVVGKIAANVSLIWRVPAERGKATKAY